LVRHEIDVHGKSNATHVRIPPEWTDSLEEAQYTLTKIQTRLKELSSLQNKHLLKPTFDDSMNEEQQIDAFTQDITKVLQIRIN
jgi:flagellar biosynthesis chaperone FliJ